MSQGFAQKILSELWGDKLAFRSYAGRFFSELTNLCRSEGWIIAEVFELGRKILIELPLTVFPPHIAKLPSVPF